MLRVSTPPEIPLLRVAGTHREAGIQVGRACAETVRRAEAFEVKIPCGRTREEQLALADRYREVTSAALPWYIDELEGIAEGAGGDPRALFAAMIEEIWYEPHAARVEGRCTDLVALPPATADGRVLVAHNNDMPRTYQDQLVAIEWRIHGEPTVLSIGNGRGLGFLGFLRNRFVYRSVFFLGQLTHRTGTSQHHLRSVGFDTIALRHGHDDGTLCVSTLRLLLDDLVLVVSQPTRRLEEQLGGLGLSIEAHLGNDLLRIDRRVLHR